MSKKSVAHGLSAQFDLFGTASCAERSAPVRTAAQSGRRFISGNPSALFVGTAPLKQYLHDLGEQAPLAVSRLLDEQDWRVFEASYSPTGRAPYAPRGMMGLILYGVMQGVHSLRELERLARLDLGCMWVCGGIMPDHANIGRFIVLHESVLTQAFFESLTRTVLQVCRSQSQRIAGDGTVIEAACSHYNLLKEQAVKEHAQALRQRAEQNKTDEQAQRQAEHAKHCEQQFDQRKASRQKHGKDTRSLCISAVEPDAMVQRLKRGRGVGASYKPSVLANEDQIITAVAVDASSETVVVEQMLDQHARITGSEPAELLLDAGYFDDGVIQTTLERDISLLCPSPIQQTEAAQVREGEKFHKSLFRYDPQTDCYCCPAGQILVKIARTAASDVSRECAIYACPSCNACPLRGRCTTAKVRRIKRYPQDQTREALRHVMRQPGAQRVFAQRKAMVEPVFARLRGQQNLTRFRRRGLAAVTREFALHAMAYNLARAAGAFKSLYILLFVLCAALYLTRMSQNARDRFTQRSRLQNRHSR